MLRASASAAIQRGGRAYLPRTTRRHRIQLQRHASGADSGADVAALQAENALLKRKLAALHDTTTPPSSETPPEQSLFVGARSEYVSSPNFLYPGDPMPAPIPCFRLIDDLGNVVDGADDHLPTLGQDEALALQRTMLRVSEFDKIMNEAQRQGRVSFYLTSRGEEACSVGSAAALEPNDWLLPQYRELGAAMVRGFTFREIANQCCANKDDPAHGRQLPLHIGSHARRFVTVKSTLGTQCPHAAGVGFAMKRLGQKNVSLAYFGEGCASEGDVPSALNIAAVHGCATIFFCRNNGYAISTKVSEQYVSDGIAPRGVAFGMPALRVDGNDILAVIAATRRAKQIATDEGRPALIEAMTYRVGAHSTSDDDSKYRTHAPPTAGWDSERAYWEARSPIVRFGRFLQARGWYSVAFEEEVRKEARREAIAALNAAEREEKPEVDHLFTDVLDEPPWMLQKQRDELRDHLARYEDSYERSKWKADA